MVPLPPKVGPVKKVCVLKISLPKAKPGPRCTSEIELALVKPIGVSKKFCLLDVVASSHAHAVGTTVTHTAQVPAFNNLGDDLSPDVCKTPSLEWTTEKRVSPSPSVSGELLLFSFMIFTVGPDNWFCRSSPACSLARFAI
jgi:hypothetical protein